ncbi:MAG: Holliday junction resolvase RuvX [Geodermatophilaceae bacterium]|nr:Holliday junction resolvase RuvX [Geodermatophilaceae bacterium]MDQ3465123.1 Holliday junction resolvase RuvX [Actinomycetota bacterium]
MTTGRRLGIDVGSVRVGVALSDPAGILASPLVTLARDSRSGRDLVKLGELVLEHGVVEVIVGLPRHLSGHQGASAKDARDYAERLGRRIDPVPVQLVDERLSTVSASRTLREQGVRRHDQRIIIDQAAAAYILQGWLDGSAQRGD